MLIRTCPECGSQFIVLTRNKDGHISGMWCKSCNYKGLIEKFPLVEVRSKDMRGNK